MHPFEIFMTSFVGGATPCILLGFAIRSVIRTTMTKMHEEAKIRCPLCKRSGALEGTDVPCEFSGS